MIDNPNPNNFYNIEMLEFREKYIPKLKSKLLEKIKDLEEKIKSEEPFPHRNISIDDLSKFDSEVEILLNNWYY